MLQGRVNANLLRFLTLQLMLRMAVCVHLVRGSHTGRTIITEEEQIHPLDAVIIANQQLISLRHALEVEGIGVALGVDQVERMLISVRL